MLNDKMVAALNEQIALEAASSYTYLAMASWCDKEGIAGCAEFFYAQSGEERVHMLKILRYVNEMDAHAIVPAIAQPANTYDSIQKIFKQVYEQEQKITRAIYSLLSLCQELQDHATTNFLQWYVTEQREEEALVRGILDKIKLIGDGGQSLYYIDKEIDLVNAQRLAAPAEAPAE
jgi:ferritin